MRRTAAHKGARLFGRTDEQPEGGAAFGRHRAFASPVRRPVGVGTDMRAGATERFCLILRCAPRRTVEINTRYTRGSAIEHQQLRQRVGPVRQSVCVARDRASRAAADICVNVTGHPPRYSLCGRALPADAPKRGLGSGRGNGHTASKIPRSGRSRRCLSCGTSVVQGLRESSGPRIAATRTRPAVKRRPVPAFRRASAFCPIPAGVKSGACFCAKRRKSHS